MTNARARHAVPLHLASSLREEHGDGAICLSRWRGLLRCARNDGVGSGHDTPCPYACPGIYLECLGVRAPE